MSTPEKPRPSLDDTLARIEARLAEEAPAMPFGYVTPAERDLVLKTTGIDTSFMVATPGHEKPSHLTGAPGPTCPGCAADAARPAGSNAPSAASSPDIVHTGATMHIVCGIDEPRPDFPDLELGCCYGATMRGACTCWRPVYDEPGQADPDEDMTPVVRPDGMCGDCAYRPGSPEKAGDPEHRGDADTLEQLAESGKPFYCHDGMRRIVKWVHPSGAEVPGHPADYAPPIAGSVPYRADGTPGYLCAGWDARRRALEAKAAGS